MYVCVCHVGNECVVLSLAMLKNNSASKLVRTMGEEEHEKLVALSHKSFKEELSFFREASFCS